jgi:hypothetical protein
MWSEFSCCIADKGKGASKEDWACCMAYRFMICFTILILRCLHFRALRWHREVAPLRARQEIQSYYYKVPLQVTFCLIRNDPCSSNSTSMLDAAHAAALPVISMPLCLPSQRSPSFGYFGMQCLLPDLVNARLYG